MDFKRAVRLAGLTSVVMLALTTGSASAEQRGVIAGDPADAPPTVSGQPSNPDVGAVDIAYDTAGSLRLTINYFNAFSGLDTSQRYAFSGKFGIGTPTLADDPVGGCSPELNGQHHVYRPGRDSYFYDRATVTGFDGYLQFNRTVSPDQRVVTLTATGPALANRDWRCATYSLYSRTRSTASNINSDYDETCDCWYVSETLDKVGEDNGAGSQTIWFNGLRPVKPVKPQPAPPAAKPPAKPKVKNVKFSVRPKASLRGGKLRLSLKSGPEVLGRRATVTLQAPKGKHRRYRKLGKSNAWRITKKTQSKTFRVSRRHKKLRAIVTVRGYTNKAANRKYATKRVTVIARGSR